MQLKKYFVLAAATLSFGNFAHASAPSGSVVAVRYLVSEHVPERLEQTVALPVERVLAGLARVSKITTTTRQGSVEVECHFDGGATEEDLETVRQRIDQLVLDKEVVVTSRTVLLGAPGLY